MKKLPKMCTLFWNDHGVLFEHDHDQVFKFFQVCDIILVYVECVVEGTNKLRVFFVRFLLERIVPVLRLDEVAKQALLLCEDAPKYLWTNEV